MQERITHEKFQTLPIQEQLRFLIRTRSDFAFFIENIFSESKEILKEGIWIGGEYPQSIGRFMQSHRKTMRVSARDHFKSMSFYAHFMWTLWRMQGKSLESHYFSYEEGMAAYHCAKIKKAISSNPYFSDVIDVKKTAESVLKYTWDGKHFVWMEPHGLLSFKRGIHCPLLYVDDPLRDPEQAMLLTNIKKINSVMKSQILDMSWNEIHVVGTSQTPQDFYFDKNLHKTFSVRILPAMVDKQNKVALWPEWMPWQVLEDKRAERGEKIFNQEYLCRPVFLESAFFSEKELLESTNASLKNFHIHDNWFEKERNRRAKMDPPEEMGDIIAALDIGKKAHPSHFAIFEHRPEQKRKWVQVHQIFFDGVDYSDQLEYCLNAIDAFGIDRLYYDNTRGEFESFSEEGRLPGQMEPVQFTVKKKNSMAVQLSKAVSNGEVEFLNDERMRNQMLAVNNELKAIETPEGHGDSFWSIAMCFIALESEGLGITILRDESDSDSLSE